MILSIYIWRVFVCTFKVCDWTDRNDKIDKLVEKIHNKEKVITPFPLSIER